MHTVHFISYTTKAIQLSGKVNGNYIVKFLFKMNATATILPHRPLAGPAMKACLAFIPGILLAEYISPGPYTCIALFAAAILILILFHRQHMAGSLLAFAVLLLAGLTAAVIHREIDKPLDVTAIPLNTQVSIEGSITGSTRYSYGNTYIILKCKAIENGIVVKSTYGKLPCVFYDRTIPLEEGTTIRVRGEIRRIRHPVTGNDLARGFIDRTYSHRLAAGRSLPDPEILANGGIFFSKAGAYISGLIDRYPYGGHSDILRAMTIGESSAVPKETRARFAESGIAHILAVSGLHVGILTMLLMLLIQPVPVSKPGKYIIVITFLAIYAGICGFRPPVTRSVVMFALVVGPVMFERRKNVENSLFVSLLIILACNPESLFGPSLQLSFAAVWTITTFYTPLFEHLPVKIKRSNRFIRYTAGLLLVSMLAYAGTAPVVAMHFGSIPLYGIIVNLPGVPLAFLTVALGTASISMTALGFVVSPVAAVLSFFTGLSLSLLIRLTEFVSNLPYASIETDNFPLYLVLGIFFWLYVMSRAANRQSCQKLIVYIPLMLIFIVTWSPLVTAIGCKDPHGSVIFFDVGQGDAALVCYDNERYFLFDTGPVYDTVSPAETVILPGLNNLGIKELDGIFISHIHSDHIGGLESVLDKINVKRIFCRMSVRDSLAYFYGDMVTGLSAGDSLGFDEGGMFILSPGKNSDIFDSSSHSGENNCSLIVRCDIAGNRILFTGDVEETIQKHLVLWDSFLDADILKVPHHGAKGLNQDFIDLVTPIVSVISCGVNNRYNHPDCSTLNTISASGSELHRTDRKGSIIMKLPLFFHQKI